MIITGGPTHWYRFNFKKSSPPCGFIKQDQLLNLLEPLKPCALDHPLIVLQATEMVYLYLRVRQVPLAPTLNVRFKSCSDGRFWFLLCWSSGMDLISDRDGWRGLSDFLSLPFPPCVPLRRHKSKAVKMLVLGVDEHEWEWTWSVKYICQQFTANRQHATWQRASLIAQSCQLTFSIFFSVKCLLL